MEDIDPERSTCAPRADGSRDRRLLARGFQQGDFHPAIGLPP